MANPSSNFLRGVSDGGSEGSAQLPDETAILMAVNKPDPTGVTVETLAAEFRTGTSEVSRVLGPLMSSCLIESAEGGLKLTEAGQRAIRYTNVAR